MKDIQKYKTLALLSIAVVALDQATKYWAMQAIPQYRSVPVINGFFDLVHIRNRGAAFGFLNRSDIEWQFWLFLGATVLAVGAIMALVRSSPKNSPALIWGFGLVLGGAIGNLIDRICFRSVMDFLDFYIGEWHWPAFNVADIAICCGAFLVCLSMWCTPDTKGSPTKSTRGTQAAPGAQRTPKRVRT